jgi:carbon storage regulator
MQASIITAEYIPMLIIPRSKDQSIVIGDGIVVNVIEIDEDEVRLSIEYPEGVSVETGDLVAAAELATNQPEAL